MVDKKIQVSIGLVVYNGEKYIREALDSLLAQTFTDFELIISDNASTDGTLDICKSYVDKDSRVRYVRHKENRGVVWNFNFVFSQATSDYFMWASHDDCWKPTYIQECLQALQEHKTAISALTVWDDVDIETGRVLSSSQPVTTVGMSAAERFLIIHRLLYVPSQNPAVFYGIHKREDLLSVMPLRNVFAMDHVFWVDFALRGAFIAIDKHLMLKRTGGSGSTFKDIAKATLVTNPFAAWCLFLIREFHFQRIIFQSARLAPLEKIHLSGVSLFQYSLFLLKRIYWFFRDGLGCRFQKQGG